MGKQNGKVFLGVDPGGTTGWCLLRIKLPFSPDKIEVVDSGQIGEGYDEWTNFFKSLEHRHIDEVWIESTIMTGYLNRGKKVQICATDRVSYWAHTTGKEGGFVPPVERKTLGGLLKCPVFVKGGHARDAFHIALAGIVRQHAIPLQSGRVISYGGK